MCVNVICVIVLHVLGERRERGGMGSSKGWVKDVKRKVGSEYGASEDGSSHATTYKELPFQVRGLFCIKYCGDHMQFSMIRVYS